MPHVNIIPEYLQDKDLDEIATVIKQIEKKTSGELRLCVKKKKGFLEKKKHSRTIALKMFKKLKMHKTKDKTGVLMFIIFDDHEFEIIADAGINSKIPQEKWESISEKIKHYFKSNEYLEGILQTLNEIGEVLISEFPIKDGDTDELSNEVVIRR